MCRRGAGLQYEWSSFWNVFWKYSLWKSRSHTYASPSSDSTSTSQQRSSGSFAQLLMGQHKRWIEEQDKELVIQQVEDKEIYWRFWEQKRNEDGWEMDSFDAGSILEEFFFYYFFLLFIFIFLIYYFFILSISPTSGDRLSRTKRLYDRLSLERARHGPKKTASWKNWTSRGKELSGFKSWLEQFSGWLCLIHDAYGPELGEAINSADSIRSFRNHDQTMRSKRLFHLLQNFTGYSKIESYQEPDLRFGHHCVEWFWTSSVKFILKSFRFSPVLLQDE